MKNTTIDFTSDDRKETGIKLIPMKISGEINLPERNSVETIITKEQLRDRFAEKAMNGIMQTRYSEEFMSEFLGITLAVFRYEIHWPKFVSKMSYAMADAMLKEREK